MRAMSWVVLAAVISGLGIQPAPAWAYYADDHVWDREYQSGSEWRVARTARPVPWVASNAWNRGFPDTPAGSWWQSATPVAPGYIPFAPEWTQTYRGAQPWDRAAWNVPWWNPQAPLLTNHRYRQAAFDSSQNPYSNQRLNADLSAAAAYGDVRLVQALMSRGADHNARDWEGFTALTWAAQFGRREVVEYLLARHSHLNVVDRWGYTPLMWALQQGHVAIAALLLSRGANPSVSTPFGITPLVLATHAAGGTARGLVEDALARRPIRLELYAAQASSPLPPPSSVYFAPPMAQPADRAPVAAPAVPAPVGAAPAVPAPAVPAPVMAAPVMPMMPLAPQPSAGWRWNGQMWVQGAAEPSALPHWVPGPLPEQPAVQRMAGVLEPEPLVLPMVSLHASQHADGLGPLAPLPLAERGDTSGAGTGGRFKKMDSEAGWQRISSIAGYFGSAYHKFVLEKHQNKKAAAAEEPDPEDRVAAHLNRTFGRALQKRDPLAARADVELAKRRIQVHTRFLPYLTALDETLLAMGH